MDLPARIPKKFLGTPEPEKWNDAGVDPNYNLNAPTNIAKDTHATYPIIDVSMLLGLPNPSFAEMTS